MKFGIFYEHQVPKPWADGDEEQLYHEALEQVVLADQLGIDFAWEVEHHFLEEYSHSSSPEVFLAAAAALTKRIRLGHGIRQVIPKYNHPARSAECIATLDLVSRGRVEFGIGESATRLELGGFEISAKHKRAMALDAAEQICNMMAMSPYPGYEGEYFSMPCRNVVPKPVQKPHPPLWMACTNRDTIRAAARAGVGALAFSFVDPDEAKNWVHEYYSIIESDQCVPLGHRVNANIAMVTSFSVHEDRAEAIRRGHEGFEFFGYALTSLVTKDLRPGYTSMWEDYVRERGDKTARLVAAAEKEDVGGIGIGTPDDMRRHLRGFQDVGVDQIIFLQQAGRNRHSHICDSLRTFATQVMPEFKEHEEEREKEKAERLAPAIDAALRRKEWMPALPAERVPVVPAAVDAPLVPAKPGD